MMTIKYEMMTVWRLFVNVRILGTVLRLGFDPGSKDATVRYNLDTEVAAQALRIPILLIGESFVNRLTKHKIPEAVSGEYFRGIKRFSMLLFL